MEFQQQNICQSTKCYEMELMQSTLYSIYGDIARQKAIGK